MCSGQGVQAVYFIESLDSSLDNEDWVSAQRGLYQSLKKYGSDKVIIGDSSRVFRLAGTYNQKQGGARPATIYDYEDSVAYSIDDLMEAFPVQDESNNNNLVAKDRSFRIPDEIVEGGDGLTYEGRNQFLWNHLGFVHEQGYSRESAKVMLMGLNKSQCRPPLEEAVIESMVERTYNKGASTKSPKQYEAPEEPMVLKTYNRGRNPLTAFGRSDDIVLGLSQGEWGKFDALSGTGKTTFWLNVAISVACGRPFHFIYNQTLNHKEWDLILDEAGEATGVKEITNELKPRKVLLLLTENNPASTFFDIDRMMDEMGLSDAERELANQNLDYRFQVSESLIHPTLTDPAVLDAYARLINEVESELVIIDTLSECYDIEDENNARQCIRGLVQPMKYLTQRTNAAYVILHHTGKMLEGSTGAGINKGRGSTAINAAAHSVYLAEQDGKDYGDEISQVVTFSFPKVRRLNKPRKLALALKTGGRVFGELDDEEMLKEALPSRQQPFVDFVARNQPGVRDAVGLFMKENIDAKRPTVDRWRRKAIELGEILESDGKYVLAGVEI